MKHNHDWLRKEFSKIRDEITRNYVLNTLTKSDKELQQLDLCTIEKIVQFDLHGYEAQGFRKGVAWLKKEILGDIPRKEKPDIVKTVRALMDPYKEGENQI